jgi:hypothetical protein
VKNAQDEKNCSESETEQVAFCYNLLSVSRFTCPLSEKPQRVIKRWLSSSKVCAVFSSADQSRNKS